MSAFLASIKQYFHRSVKIILPFFLMISVCSPSTLIAADSVNLTNSASGTLRNSAQIVSKSGETLSLFWAILKVIGSLGLVLGVMLLLAYIFKRIGFSGSNLKQGSLIKILDTRMLAPKKYVSVLQIAQEYVVVGITDQNINMLSKLNDSEAIEKFSLAAATTKTNTLGNSFSTLLQKAAKNITKPNSQE